MNRFLVGLIERTQSYHIVPQGRTLGHDLALPYHGPITCVRGAFTRFLTTVTLHVDFGRNTPVNSWNDHAERERERERV